jgi:hypothetical protein
MHLSGEDESVYLKRRKHLVWQLVPYIFIFFYFFFIFFIFLTQMDKEIHCKKERNLDILFHCTRAIQSWEARSNKYPSFSKSSLHIGTTFGL